MGLFHSQGNRAPPPLVCGLNISGTAIGFSHVTKGVQCWREGKRGVWNWKAYWPPPFLFINSAVHGAPHYASELQLSVVELCIFLGKWFLVKCTPTQQWQNNVCTREGKCTLCFEKGVVETAFVVMLVLHNVNCWENNPKNGLNSLWGRNTIE